MAQEPELITKARKRLEENPQVHAIVHAAVFAALVSGARGAKMAELTGAIIADAFVTQLEEIDAAHPELRDILQATPTEEDGTYVTAYDEPMTETEETLQP